MKITMDKELTPVAKSKIVKEAMKEFKTKYTDSDILYNLMEQVDDGWEMDGRILSCEVEAYPTTSLSWDTEVRYRVEIITSGGTFVFKLITAYIDSELRVVSETNVTCERYEIAGVHHYFKK